MGPFDFIKAINENKNIMKNDVLTEKEYNAFLVNRGLSYFQDTILQTNEMNRHHHLDKKLQFDYLRTSVRSRRRWSKWLKADKIENLEMIKTYFGYGNEKAKDALEILSENDIVTIKQKFEEGGITKK
jgi:hypothetical protein